MKNKNLNKEEIYVHLSEKTGLSLNYTKKVIDDLIDCMKECLIENDLILKNIGSFKIINKNERIGRNPMTKEEFLIKKRRTISFKSSKSLRDKLNKS